MLEDRLAKVPAVMLLVPRQRGFHGACADLDPERRFVIYPGEESYPLGNGAQAVTLPDLARILSEPRS